MERRRFLKLAGGSLPLGAVSLPPLFSPTLAFSQAPAKDGDDQYQPQVGQPGKDVVWVPTPDALVRAMLEKAKVGSDDLVFDLGCGDGKIPIAAARHFNAVAKGIEYEPNMAALARRNAERAGVANKVEIITGDIFDPALQERFMRATVITMYLLPHLNLKLRPSILAMRPGTRVVSHAFHMSDWEPDETFSVEGRDAYYWVVPASFAGKWTLTGDNGWEGAVEVTQHFQRIGGMLRIKGRGQPLLSAYVSGSSFGFTFADTDDRVKSARLILQGNRLTGSLHLSPGLTVPVEGKKSA